MKELERLCTEFVENCEVVKGVFKLESAYLYPICANVFCSRGVPAREERLAECKRLLRERAGVFSNFRGIIQAPVACMLAAGTDAEGRMDRAMDCYRLLKERFFRSEFLALAAFLMADMTGPARAREKAERSRALYEAMKKEHPFLTSAEDSVFAVLMAFSEKSDEALLTDMETCYRLLKERFSDGNAVQSASHVLALAGGDPAEETAKMLALYDGLREAGGKYGRHHELATLAAAACLDAEPETLLSQALAADAFLAEQKGYGVLGLDRRTRMMHAVILASDLYAPDAGTETAALTGTVSLIAAQQAAMCAMLAATAASASSSHG